LNNTSGYKKDGGSQNRSLLNCDSDADELHFFDATSGNAGVGPGNSSRKPP